MKLPEYLDVEGVRIYHPAHKNKNHEMAPDTRCVFWKSKCVWVTKEFNHHSVSIFADWNVGDVEVIVSGAPKVKYIWNGDELVKEG